MPKPDLPSLNPRERVSDLDHVYAQLSSSIMMGEFVPGQKLKLNELAEVFKTSHMPVREALSRLVVAKVLEAAPRRSVSVPLVSAERLDNLISIRILLECRAVALVSTEPNPALADRLTAANAKLDRETQRERPSIKNYLAANHEFHFLIYNACGNPDLTSLIELMWMRYGSLLNLLRTGNVDFARHDHHAEIIEGIRTGDAKLAMDNLEADLQEAAVIIREVVNQMTTA